VTVCWDVAVAVALVAFGVGGFVGLWAGSRSV